MKAFWGVLFRPLLAISTFGIILLYVMPLSCSFVRSPTPEERAAAGTYVDSVLANAAKADLRKIDLLIKPERKKVVVQIDLPPGIFEEEVLSEFSRGLSNCKLSHVSIEFGEFEILRFTKGPVEVVEKKFTLKRRVNLR